MSKVHLMIAGHGSGDSGATGFISKGEYRYMKEDLFPAMERLVPKGEKVIFFSDYNVYSRGNIVALAKQFGADVVTEFHYDAGGVSYSKAGGHVIIHSDLQPDDLDKRLVNAIKKTTGIHPSYPTGISKRNNLANVNRTATGGVNYRLLELGMCTHKENAEYLIKNVDVIAKELMIAFFGKVEPVSSFDLYRVQVGAYKEMDNAIAMKDKLVGLGFSDAFITSR